MRGTDWVFKIPGYVSSYIKPNYLSILLIHIAVVIKIELFSLLKLRRNFARVTACRTEK